MPLYKDPGFFMPRKVLPDVVYGKAMESFVVVCADVLFLNQENEKALLTHRKAKPMQGLWIVGGRIFAGEHEVEAIRRSVKRETSLDLAPHRFAFLCMNRYLNKVRQQEPQNKGSDTLAYTFVAQLSPTEREIASEHLDPKEYDTSKGLQEFDENMMHEQGVHQAIIDLYKMIKK